MKKLIVSILINLLIFPSWAQQNSSTQQPTYKHTPEQIATIQSTRFVKRLGINETQRREVYDLTLEKVTNAREIRVKMSGDKTAMRTELNKNMVAYNDRLKTLLTPEQYDKLEKLREIEKQKRMEKRQQMKEQNNKQETEKQPSDTTDIEKELK